MSSGNVSRHDSDVKEQIDHVQDAPKTFKVRTPEERQAQLLAATAADPGLTPWTARAVKFYLIVLCITCCSGDSGFDGTVMSGINAMKQYQHYFGLRDAGARTGIVFGIYTIGNLVGALPASYLPDRVGRRWSMFLGNLTLIVGAIITATATGTSRFLGGRFLTGVGVSVAGASAKSYLAEITPPQTRGRYLGILNSFYYVGQMTATGMMIGTQKWQNTLSWRLPLWVQTVPAGLNVLFVFLCPESPRWLHTVGKSEQARAILARLHSRDNDVNSPLVQLEVDEIEEYIKLGGADNLVGLPSFVPHPRRPCSHVVLIGAFGQLSGNGMVTYFLTVLLRIAGITSSSKQITLNFVNSVTSMIGALTGAYLVDSFGRRKLLLSGTAALVVILAIASGLLSHPETSQARANAGITFIYLFMVVFSFGYTGMQALYPAEVLTYQMRAKGLAFLALVAQAASCINTFGLPVALDKIGWKVYVIFCIWDAFEVVVIYFTVVETKGLTLEEIEEVFAQPDPVKYSIEHSVSKRKAEINKV
ncbi:general substrate transporter [Auricularia subglabra TFB-10046 SS5]|nr:general substrate transporter [Auricularia subglabra TFB-10046 SS5]